MAILLGSVTEGEKNVPPDWASESGRFSGQSRLRSRPSGRRPVANDPNRTSVRSARSAFAYRTLLEYQAGLLGLVRLGAGELDHLAPLLGLISDELPEVGGRARKRSAAHVGNPRVDLRVGEARIDLLVEPINDFDGRVLRRADTLPRARLVPRQKIANPREVRQRLRTPCTCHRQCPKFASPYIFDGCGHGAEHR